MRRGVRYIPVFAAVAVLGAAGAHAALWSRGSVNSQRAVSSTLHAFVHDDSTIGLTFDDGSPVGSQQRTPPSIPPGTYTIKVIDDAGEHNFHITGPGVDLATDVGGSSSPTWTVTFQPGGSYEYLCDAHPDFMYGNFTTTGTGTGGGTTGGGTSSGGTSSGGTSSGGGTSSSGGTHTALLGTLIGRVDPAGKLTLTYGGVPVTKVKAGRYKITVGDKTPKRSFMVERIGHAAMTVSGVAFVGTHSVTLDLLAGKWTFFTSAGAKSTTTFTVTP